MMMVRTCLFLTGCIVFAACGSKSGLPSGVLPQKQMQTVLFDILQTDAFTGQFQIKDSAKQHSLLEENAKLQQQVFALHGTTKETFYKSYDYYKEHSELMKLMLDSMIDNANKKRTN